MEPTTTSPELSPTPDLHFDAMDTSHLLGVAPYRGLHVESSVAGPYRVILVGQWRPEKCHDPSPPSG